MMISFSFRTRRALVYLWLPILLSVAGLIARETFIQNPSWASVTPNEDVLMFEYEQHHIKATALPDPTTPYADLFAFDTDGFQFRSGECKPLPGDVAWPSLDEWNALNRTLSGSLIATVPFAAPCYNGWGVYDAERCAVLQDRWTDPWLHEDDPTSVMWPLWQGNTCLPTSVANATCGIGAFPAYVVNVSTVAQIQLAVNFARNKGIRLVIKNTGHDYLGKSMGAGSLSIWTHNLQDLEYIPNLHIGAWSGNAVHIGAGVRSLDIYRLADEHEGTIVGGMCGSVGFAGGYFAGGGHSPLSSAFGMAADHIVALGVVTAGGQFITVTEGSHPDLFWALRGGGAGTFGITTSVIARMQPPMQMQTSWIDFGTSTNVSDDTFWLGVRAYFENFLRFNQAGCYGYLNIRRSYKRYRGSSYSVGIEPIIAYNMSPEDFTRLLQPFLNALDSLGIPYTQKRKSFPSFYDGFIDSWPESLQTVTTPTMTEATRFFPAEIWEDPEGFNRTLAAIRAASETGHDITGWQISLSNPSGARNAINPAMRHAVAFFTTGVLIPSHASPTDMRAAQAELDEVLSHWREAAPVQQNGGSYLNEASVMEPEWQSSLYGSNYPDLFRIKKIWDPSGLFYATTAVGSEEWEVRTMDQGLQTQKGPLCRL